MKKREVALGELEQSSGDIISNLEPTAPQSDHRGVYRHGNLTSPPAEPELSVYLAGTRHWHMAFIYMFNRMPD